MAAAGNNPSVHASVVQCNQGAVMLFGPSGSGKSSLALALIRQKNATLVADDRVLFHVDEQQQLCATAPQNIAGLLEVRGMGLLRIGTEGAPPQPAVIRLAVELVARKDVPRMPAQIYLPPQNDLQHLPIPLLRLHAFDTQTVDVIMLALATIGQHGFADDAINKLPKDA